MEKRTGIFSRLIGHALLIFNISAVCWLGFCYLAATVSPDKIGYLSFFSLTTPLAIFCNIAFIILWLVSRKKIRFLISLIALVLSYPLINVIFAFNFSKVNVFSPGPHSVKIMHWNIHSLGMFSKNRTGRQDSLDILDFIEEQDADIISLPEYYMWRDSSNKKTEKRIQKRNAYLEYKFNMDNTYGTKVMLGTIIFSKFPLLDYTVYDLGHSIYMQQCDVQLGSKKIRMLMIHLFSFNLSEDDRAYLHEVRENGPVINTEMNHSRSFVWKFNNSYKIRAQEADTIAAIIKASPYPVLICGDFNDLPASYTYTTIRGKLNDAFLDNGKGIGRTYNQIFPTLRIDHMLYDPTVLRLIGYKSPTILASDHNPVICNFEIVN